jgi:hypothetical protein
MPRRLSCDPRVCAPFSSPSQSLCSPGDRARLNLISLLTLASISATVCIDSKASRVYWWIGSRGSSESLGVKQPLTLTTLIGFANGFHQRYVPPAHQVDYRRGLRHLLTVFSLHVLLAVLLLAENTRLRQSPSKNVRHCCMVKSHSSPCW